MQHPLATRKHRVDSGLGGGVFRCLVLVRQVLAEAITRTADHAQDGDKGEADQEFLHRMLRYGWADAAR